MSRHSVLAGVSAAWAIAACAHSTSPASRPAPVNVAMEGTATASATWENNPTIGPEKVIDGSSFDVNTPPNYWYLPNRTAGWWQVDLGGKFDISSIEIYNTNNSVGNDRGTKDFRVEILDPDRKSVFTQGGVLPFTSQSGPDHPTQPYKLALDKIKTGRYVKVYIDSWYPTRTDSTWPYPVVASSNLANEGGGLNEVRVFGTPAQ